MFRFIKTSLTIAVIVSLMVGFSGSAFAQSPAPSEEPIYVEFNGAKDYEHWYDLKSNQALRVATMLGEHIFIGDDFKVIKMVRSESALIDITGIDWTIVEPYEAIVVSWSDGSYFFIGDGETVSYMMIESQPAQ